MSMQQRNAGHLYEMLTRESAENDREHAELRAAILALSEKIDPIHNYVVGAQAVAQVRAAARTLWVNTLLTIFTALMAVAALLALVLR